MKPIPSTAEILAFKVLGRAIDKTWVNWAYDMLEAGFETENLVILAGEIQPYNQFELQSLTDRVFIELNLALNNRERILKKYVCYLVDKALTGEVKFIAMLGIVKDMYFELDHDSSFGGFYLLYWAYDDLEYSEQQWYWDGATRENIDEMARDYFIQWKAECAELFNSNI
ncbi:hypothetical protein IDJ75_01650 [Mucilaginibacter rigui]|uniref:DUF4240 domain-containing protein n=1 Tax=Mucilaginibacter rigui TaxID=534635 RepID=A0ABR7X048_9SPHI|nr:hypothetical protein [Mucilaginibacter rigui]MBD1383967.1 hypothetical protein [Mucilaginibacter rigui]